jgi:hypothetical protein
MAQGSPTTSSHPLSNLGGGFFVALLVLILISACALRLYGFDWGSGQHLHPDEIGITNAALQRINWPPGTSLSSLLDPQSSPLNPRSAGVPFPYGALPLYLDKIAATIFTSGDYRGDWLTGRSLTGLYDTATVLLVFLLGAALWSRSWGLLASSFYAFGILPIQMSHYFTPESSMAFFMTAALLLSLLYYQRGRTLFLLLAALSCGLAMACKLSAAPALILPVAALLLCRLPITHDRPPATDQRQLPSAVVLVFLIAVAAFAGLFIGDPYAILDAPAYLSQVADQAAVQSGAADLWFTRRYVGTLPIIYPWWQLTLLGIGPLVGIVGTLGASIALYRFLRRHWTYALLLSGALTYFASIAFLEAKWIRYLLPLIPYLSLFATLAVMQLAIPSRATANRQSAFHIPHSALATLLLVSALFGALAFTSVYRHEHPAVQATRWLFANVPPGGKIGVETNDGVLPLRLPGYPDRDKQYAITELRMLADFPSPQASTYLRDGLRSIDYLVVGSIRGSRTVPHMPWRYPVQVRYYDLLFSGQLGFSPIYTATDYPSFFGLTFPDDNDLVDASFIEYDHPTIRIFKKDHDLTDQEWSTLFATAVAQTSLPTRHSP